MKWIKRILFALLGLVLLIVVVYAGIIIFDSLFGPDTADFTNVTYTDQDGTELIGYLAQPEGEGPFPGILLLHEWWGLTEDITVLADALATEGYVVFAPDAYRGKVTAQVPRALWLRLTTPEAQVFNDVDAGLAHLMSLDNVDTDRLAVMGFCFGGGQALQLTMRQPENLPLTIVYYGTLVTEPDLLRPLTESQGVLGIFGTEDQSIPVEEVQDFEAALNSLNIPNDITIYEGVGHAFLNADNYDQPGAAGEAWGQTLAFLAENFGEN